MAALETLIRDTRRISAAALRGLADLVDVEDEDELELEGERWTAKATIGPKGLMATEWRRRPGMDCERVWP